MSNTSNETQSTMQLQAEQQKTQAAEAAQGFLQSILDTGREPFLVLDATLNVVTANRAFYQTFATDEAGTLGRFVYDLGDGQWDIPVLRRLLEEVLPAEAAFEGYEVTHDFPGVGTKTIRLNGRKLYRLGNHTTMFLLALEDVTSERAAQAALSAAGDRAADILESITDAFFALDQDWRFTYLNDQGERLLQRPRGELLGKSVWDEFPEAVGSAFEQEYRRAVSEGTAASFEQFYPPLAAWFEVRAYPSPEGLSVYFHDISLRRQSDEALRDSEERLRLATEGAGVGIWKLYPATGELTWSDRCNEIFGLPAGSSIPLTGDMPWSLIRADDLPGIQAALQRSADDNVAFEAEYRVFTPSGETRWIQASGKPYYDAARDAVRLEGVLMDITPHHEAADHLAAAYEVERRRAEREALLNRISAAIRVSDDPAEIQQVAVTALAEALGADRCYFAQFLPLQGLSEITTEYYRPPLPPVASQYALSDVPSLADDLYAGSQAISVCDTRTAKYDLQTAEFLTRLRLRSFVRLPLREGAGVAAALVVAMADAPRDWTPEEIALVEAVATQTRTAVADARVRLREHRIATQLQDALQPPLLASAPGLALGKYYEAALDEAGVGGDFFDVFPISATCTALVVGDLSGKGLAAAAQVSTVRNMLRATLYLGQSVAEAIVNLNDILADNSLLSGFATLFVGVYDASSGLLRYVNCGQEPGLVRRAATGQVEMLNPTGPVLGAFPGAAYTQDHAVLRPGDALALFTDGLTEAGPSRANMLELEGVAALLAAGIAPAEDAAAQAEALTLSLIDSVDRFAASGVRDDVCLLVAVATA